MSPSGQKIGRIYTDALVGLPTFGLRNYSAAQTQKLDMKKLRFAKRSSHYSMFVEGLVYDEIGSIQEIARDGNLPITWLIAGGWQNHDQDPPDELWRTIVANRGPDGRNALAFYPTAFKQSVNNGRVGDIMKTAHLIKYGQCSIVAQFLRRIQAVIWNRRLMHTMGHRHVRHDECKKPKKPASLGLVHQDAVPGDLICFLYGCTVPVILRRVEILPQRMETERIEDEEAREEEEVRITVRRLRDAIRSREKTRGMRKIGLKEPQRRHGLSLVDKTPASHYCKSKEQAVMTVPPWVERALRRYQMLASTCFPVFFSLCIQTTETKIPTHLFIAPALGIILLLIYSNRKISQELWHNVVSKCEERMKPWSKKVRSWQARIQPRSKTQVLSKENMSKYYHEFVGECYLHGMVDGEAIKYQNDNEIKAEMFELR